MKIEISGEFIKIGQLLKKIKIIYSGGKAKSFLKSNVIKINGKQTKNRSTKVYVGDTVWINYNVYLITSKK